MSEETSSLPSLFSEVLTALAELRTPASELIARAVTRISVAPVDEIHLGLHALWPYARHITREEWLKALTFELKTVPSPPRLRVDAQRWIEQWERERDAEAPKLRAEFERLQPTLRAYFDQSEKTSVAAADLTVILTQDTPRNSADAQEPSGADPAPASGGKRGDPLAAHLPPIEDYDYESFWYHDLSHLSDTLALACPVLLTIMIGVRARVNEDALFWSVLGRVYEPFAPGNPVDLEEKIASASSKVLALRIETGNADLLDYLTPIRK